MCLLRGTNWAFKYNSSVFRLSHSSGVQSLACYRSSSPVSIPGHSKWGLWWTECTETGFFSGYFGFTLTVSVYHCSFENWKELLLFSVFKGLITFSLIRLRGQNHRHLKSFFDETESDCGCRVCCSVVDWGRNGKDSVEFCATVQTFEILIKGHTLNAYVKIW